jgi:hypothetical protein
MLGVLAESVLVLLGNGVAYLATLVVEVLFIFFLDFLDDVFSALVLG